MSDDLKIEFPKVKIDELASGEKCSDDIFMTFNPLSEIERIVRDIKDRQDNVMAMEFTKIIGQLLKDNGVIPKITEIKTGGTFDKAGKVFEERYGVVIENLDFTEHDKVFEDKIKRLESSYHRHKSKICELENENYKLKQHIAELENKRIEEPTKINLNHQIKVKLTPLGAEIYYHQYDQLNKTIKARGGTQLEPQMPQIDKDGYTKFTLWHFMELYGQHIGMCKPNVIEPLNIYCVED